jgi:hypothetical protein
MTTTIRHAFALTMLGAAMPSHALDFKPADGIDAKVNGTATFGTTLRTENPDPAVYAVIPSSVVPSVPTGQLVGQQGGSDLNFAKNRPVSTVLKALVDVDVRGKSAGLFVRGSAWADATLGHAKAAYGNFPNAYTPDAPLSDHGFAESARFNGVELRDVYAWGTADVAGAKVEARFGRQVLSWGASQFFTGGINTAINPLDIAAQVRPGALPQESKVPVGMLDLKLTLSPRWNVEGFAAFESRQTVLPGCGTFFDVASLLPHGCMLSGALPAPIPNTPVSTIASLTERSILQSGFYVHRNDDIRARNGGQFGLAVRYKAEPIATEFAAYAMNTHGAQPTFRITVENVNGATLPPGLAGGLARLSSPTGLRYATMYAEDIRLFGVSFDTRIDPTANVFGELAHRPNQPLSMNANDLLNAFLLRGPASLLQINKNILAIPAGGTFDAFDRFGVTTLSVGGNKVFPKALGAERVVVSAEVGMSHVSGLPDPSVMRYGRPLAYGGAPYLLNGALTPCSETPPGLAGATGKTCTTDGFVSKDAWGVRLRVAATYANALAGAALTPSLVVAQDMSGYSYDGTFSKGRSTVRLGLRADWGKSFFADVQYTRYSGGNYNLLADRSNLMLAAGASF